MGRDHMDTKMPLKELGFRMWTGLGWLETGPVNTVLNLLVS
jgi:hypothetical protein